MPQFSVKLTAPLGSLPLDTRLLSRVLAQSPRWPHGPVSSATFELVGQEHGLSGGAVYRVRTRVAGGEVTVILKLDDREAAGRAMLFHQMAGNRLVGAVPLCYGGRLDADAGFLLLEDVTGEQGDVLRGSTGEQLRAVVRTLARIHAGSWTPEASADAPRLPRWQAAAWDEQRWSDRLAGAFARFPDLFTYEMRRRLENWPARVAAAVEELRSGPASWIHSDAHLDNVIWRADGTAVLLDWSGAAIGPPAVDLARLLIEGMADGGRLAEGRSLIIETAVDELARLGVQRIEPGTLERWMELALMPLTQSIIGWAGRPDDGRASTRLSLLRDQACRNVVAWLSNGDRSDSLGSDPS